MEDFQTQLTIVANSLLEEFRFVTDDHVCGSRKLRLVSPFSWSVEQNARETQISTRVTEGAVVSRVPLDAQIARVHSLSLNLKRETTHSLWQSRQALLLVVRFFFTFEEFSRILSQVTKR